MQPLPETVPNSISLFDAAKVKDVVFSSFHKSRDGKGFVIRYFNPADKKIDDGGEVMCLKAIQFWGFTNMAETLNENETYQSETIQLGAFKPKEIKTIYIQFS